MSIHRFLKTLFEGHTQPAIMLLKNHGGINSKYSLTQLFSKNFSSTGSMKGPSRNHETTPSSN